MLQTQKAIFIFLLSLISLMAKSQSFKFKSFSAGYRVYEINAIGNNPFNIYNQLKDSASYSEYVNNIYYNSSSGNPAILRVRNFYINGEWLLNASAKGLLKNISLNAGLLLTGKISQPIGSVSDDSRYNSLDTTKYVDTYSLTRNQQFIGANLGINKRFRIAKKFQIYTGLHYQGSIAFEHYYNQQWEFRLFTPSTGWNTKYKQLPDLKGKNFYQWQAMIPLGIEYDIYRQKIFVRLEAIAGRVGSQHRPKSFAVNEAHGLGFWIIYLPKY